MESHPLLGFLSLQDRRKTTQIKQSVSIHSKYLSRQTVETMCLNRSVRYHPLHLRLVAVGRTSLNIWRVFSRVKSSRKICERITLNSEKMMNSPLSAAEKWEEQQDRPPTQCQVLLILILVISKMWNKPERISRNYWLQSIYKDQQQVMK